MGNLFIGAVRTRLGGAGTPGQFEYWAGRTRASIVVATMPLLVALPVILFRQGLQDHIPPVRTGAAPLGPYGISYAGRIADDALVVLALVLLCAVSTILWGYAGLARAVRHDGRNHRGLRRLVSIPGVLAAAVLVLCVVARVVGPHAFLTQGGVTRPLDGIPALAHGLDVAAAAVLGLGLATALVMVVAVCRRAHLTVGDLASGRQVGVTTSVMLWVMAIAALTSAVALGRQGSTSAYSVVTISWGSWWIAGALILVAGALVSTLGTVQSTRALRMAAYLREDDGG
jgi:hypothetical protein